MAPVSAALAGRPGPIGSATLSAILDDAVLLETEERAELALPAEYAPRVGDRVLVARGDEGVFVIGVIAGLRDTDALSTEGGARVTRTEDGLEVRGADDQVLYRYRVEGRTSVLSAEGDLELRASGRISLRAIDRVRLAAERAVELVGGDLAVLEGHRARVALSSRGIDVLSRVVSVAAEEATARVDRLSLRGRVLETTAERLSRRVDVLQTEAKRILERAEERTTEIEGVDRSHVGQLRVHARELMRWATGRAVLRAADDVSLKGERILLG